MIFRVNRENGQGRRSDAIVLDENLTFENGDEYCLEAILQHEGKSVYGGHYIIFLRLHGIWDDTPHDAHRCTAADAPEPRQEIESNENGTDEHFRPRYLYLVSSLPHAQFTLSECQRS